MPRVKEILLYTFDELSDKAKDRARSWYRDGMETFEYADSVIEDAVRMGEILGISIDTHEVRLMSGKTRRDPSVWWSGFSSQGDGACFDGSYSYAKGAHIKIRKEAPEDTELHRIADELRDIQRQYAYSLTATVKQSGHYSHRYCTEIHIDRNIGPNEISGDHVKQIEELLRDFMLWIYKGLEREYEYQSADEQVDENIRANEYEFDEQGDRA